MSTAHEGRSLEGVDGERGTFASGERPLQSLSARDGEPGTDIHRRRRVLVVDDHQETREVYAWCLRAAGWHVQEATNGEEAVTLAPLFDLDVILMDLCMPSLDGVEATRRLKMDPRTKHVPIIACTSVGSRRIEQSARDAGCVRVVCKPCSPDELRELLEGLVAGEGQGIATNHPG